MTSYCSLPRRILVIIYDAVIMTGLLMVASAVALPFGEAQKIAFQDFWFTLWLLLVCFAYLGGCWHYVGLTVGMRAWRVKLISSDQDSISWLRCLIRFVAGVTSALVIGLGFAWALFDKQKRCWHDIAARTILVKSD